MTCAHCGRESIEGSTFCSHCGQPFSGSQPADPAPLPPAPPVHVAPSAPGYAGFWRRLAAYLVDYIVVIVGIFLFFFVLGMAVTIASGGRDPNEKIFEVLGYLIGLPAVWLYFALCESSSWQATLGKRALGIKVTDVNGQPVSFARATGRYFGKIISGLLLFAGFIMIAFTERKQGLHDLMADCLVVRR